MKVLWVLALTATPLAVFTVWSVLGLESSGGQAAVIGDAADTRPAAGIVARIAPLVKTHRSVVADLLNDDPLPPASLAGLDALESPSPLGPLRNTWPAWATAREVSGEMLALPGAGAQGNLDQLRAAKDQWGALRQRLQAAKLPASTALAGVIDRRLSVIQQEISRLEAHAQSLTAADDVRSAFAEGKYDECLALSREWLTKQAAAAPPPLAESVKALQFRAEFQLDRNRSQARLKAASPAEQETLIAAFVERFSRPGPLVESERAVLARCRTYLEGLRAEAREREVERAAEAAVQAVMAGLPADFDQRVAWAARVVEKYPAESVKAAMRSRVTAWLEESIPEKHFGQQPELREAETRDGRIVRGFFREVRGAEGAVGYKRYDTLDQRENPTVDVGTWRSEDLLAAPAVPLAHRLVEQYENARRGLLRQPSRRGLWESFAADCSRLQSQGDAYRAKPGAAQELPDFRAQTQFARQVLSGSALEDLQTVWGGGKE